MDILSYIAEFFFFEYIYIYIYIYKYMGSLFSDFYSENENLTLKPPEMKIVEFGNRVNPNEVAHFELVHLDLYCLLSCL